MTTVLAPILLAVLFIGCKTSITNLTATTQPQNPNNLYRIEYQWDTTEQAVIPESIKPFVIVGLESNPMTRVRFTNNRWEAFVSIPPGKKSIIYHFKVDYQYRRFGKPGQASKLSPEYQLEVK